MFWDDKWIESVALKVRFPRLFLISSSKHAYLYQIEKWDDQEWSWKLEWMRNLFEWETRELYQLMQQLDGKNLIKESEDK